MIITYNEQHYIVPDELAEKIYKYDSIVDVLNNSTPYRHNRETCDTIRKIVCTDSSDDTNNKMALVKIAEHYGYESQSRQLIEEMAELIVALNKWWRLTRGGISVDENILSTCASDVIEEIADVKIMLDQIIYLYEIPRSRIDEFVRRKISRQLKRINDEKQLSEGRREHG